ncbi:hypothetical protein EOPP23_11380 [Endozoicomonas sp. OPT23]|uniref:FAD-binding oxidoreductase n=1 Tax=Endozoicomonas sp. OPT23 TaxID=2072845 RepID=UPI00129ABFF7|nr:FAD-binding oxidoreductase [Endozoicomonas sp. OPT23]MRI33588.1 hypothetical protein [Endozoicomonas sp. OPT23]
MPRPTYPVTLIERHQLSSNTIQLDFNVDGSFSYEAGQFIQLHFHHNGEDFKRSYSIANSPASFETTGILEVALSYVEGGVASGFFSTLEAGSELSLGGPFGILTAPENPAGQVVLAGTGTGIAPYRAMSEELLALAEKGTNITLLMGVRSRGELIYAEDLKAVADSHPNISYKTCFSREPDVDISDCENKGYIQNQFDGLNINPESDIVYLCGNPKMIDDATELLKEMGLGVRQIKREKYVFSS